MEMQTAILVVSPQTGFRQNHFFLFLIFCLLLLLPILDRESQWCAGFFSTDESLNIFFIGSWTSAVDLAGELA